MAKQSAATGAGMRYRQFAALPGPEQTRHMEALGWEGRFLLTFEALLEMERKYEDLGADIKVARELERLRYLRPGAKLSDGAIATQAERIRAIALRNQEIRTLSREEHMTTCELGQRFGMSQNHIAAILRGPLRLEIVAERMEQISQ